MSFPRYNSGPMTGDPFQIAASLAGPTPMLPAGPDPLVDLGRAYFRLMDRYMALYERQTRILAELPASCGTSGTWIRDDTVVVSDALRLRYGMRLGITAIVTLELTLTAARQIVRDARADQRRYPGSDALAKARALFREVLAMLRERKRRLRDSGYDAAGDEMLRMEPELDRLVEAIESTPARSTAGLVVRLRQFQRVAELDAEGPEREMLAMIVDEAEALAAG